MRKKILIAIVGLIVIFLAALLAWEMYVEEGIMYESLGIRIPIITKREKIVLQSGDFFDDEELRIIHLSNGHGKKILKKIEENGAWIKGEIDEKLEERLNFYTREDIYNQIPYIENKYWIFTNRSSGAKDKHSVDEVVNDYYYAVSFGIFDVDNNILYYYEYDR